jgi:hypothetical protein
MQTTTESQPATLPRLSFDFGTFEGFNFRSQCAIPSHLTAAEVVAWDHDRDGEAEFWPAGDAPAVALLFKHRASATAAELLDLDRLLHELRGDSAANYLRIHHAVNVRGARLDTLTREAVEDLPLDIFVGANLCDVRRAAAFELFELYYPEEYRVWEASLCDGLTFDPDQFLASPMFRVEEVDLGEQVAVLVASH